MTAADLFIGKVLDGKYRLDALIGRGGMGAVYRATQLALDRAVAVKLLRADVVGDAQSAERFQREALAVARLKHPNIVTVHDFGVADGAGAFLVVELLHGRTLRQELERRGTLPFAEAAGLMRQTLSAIQAAHAAGVIHRDLKPENIFLEATAGGATAKVLDFGIAKLDGASGPPRQLTLDGALVGTPLYMSPEQCRGDAVDSRSDLYSLGCVFYEMLTGRPPFVAQTMAAVIHKHVSEPPDPPSAYVPDLPAGTDDVVLRALAKRRADRYQTAGEFAGAVEAMASGTRPFASPVTDPAVSHAATILNAREAQATDAPGGSAKTRLMPANNLPHAVTTFVGRAAEVAEAGRQLDRARLLTLTGPGGIGKTRLASICSC